jgi:hypothetical protein
MNLKLTIISGGQTGADRAALDWAISRGLPHGGWCPKGRLAEDGIIPARYELKEAKTDTYAARTELNVLDSDGTVIFTTNDALTGGSKFTARLAKKHCKPLLHIHKTTRLPDVELGKFIFQHNIRRLNVAGSRHSKEPLVGTVVTYTLNMLVRHH